MAADSERPAQRRAAAYNAFACCTGAVIAAPRLHVGLRSSVRGCGRKSQIAQRTVWRAQASGGNNPGNKNDRGTSDEDIDDGEPTELSRRVFSAGVSVVGISTAIQGFRLFADDDDKRRLAQPFRRAFPFLFSNETELPSPESLRAPLNVPFAQYFFNTHAEVAKELGLISTADLHANEVDIRTRARNLFFPRGVSMNVDVINTDVRVFNYLLYSRIHAIAIRTSPRDRVEFAATLGQRCYSYLRQKLVAENVQLPPTTSSATNFLQALRLILSELVVLGWISRFEVGAFDDEDDGTWRTEGRGDLTIYCNDPVTIDTAMLIGEEQFEEISPKISGILQALLIDHGLASVSLEDYYMDLMYRPDPAAYQPRQLVTQLNFTAP